MRNPPWVCTMQYWHAHGVPSPRPRALKWLISAVQDLQGRSCTNYTLHAPVILLPMGYSWLGIRNQDRFGLHARDSSRGTKKYSIIGLVLGFFFFLVNIIRYTINNFVLMCTYTLCGGRLINNY